MYAVTYVKVEDGGILSREIQKKVKTVDAQIPLFLREVCHIVCVDGLYGYRPGVLGYLLHEASWFLGGGSCFIRRFFKRVRSRDLDVLAFGVSVLTRLIPIANLVSWDLKNKLRSFKGSSLYSGHNPSLPVPDVNSVLFHRPLFDSGVKMWSNQPYEVNDEVGFEAWESREARGSKRRSGVSWIVKRPCEKFSNWFAVINARIGPTSHSDVTKKCCQLNSLVTSLKRKHSEGIVMVVMVLVLSFIQDMDEVLRVLSFPDILHHDGKNDVYVLGWSKDFKVAQQWQTDLVGGDSVYTVTLEENSGFIELDSIDNIDSISEQEETKYKVQDIDLRINVNDEYLEAGANSDTECSLKRESESPKSQSSWHHVL